MQSTATVMLRLGIDATKEAQRSVVVLRLQNLAAAVHAVGADMVAQMQLTGGRLDGRRRSGQKIVRTMHAALGRAFFVLLNSHDDSCNRGPPILREASAHVLNEKSMLPEPCQRRKRRRPFRVKRIGGGPGPRTHVVPGRI